MPKLDLALRLLAQGAFVCPHRYADAFDALNAPGGREAAGTWLEAIGYKLCQLEEGAAFFMGYGQLDVDSRKDVREVMRNLRSRLDPVVRYLETIRQAQAGSATLQPGDPISQSSVVEAVRNSVVLERRLDAMKDVHGTRTDEKAVDRIDRILRLLKDAGYLHLGDENLRVYTVTGKITYFYQLMQFIGTHMPVINEPGVDDALDDRQLSLGADGAEST